MNDVAGQLLPTRCKYHLASAEAGPGKSSVVHAEVTLIMEKDGRNRRQSSTYGDCHHVRAWPALCFAASAQLPWILWSLSQAASGAEPTTVLEWSKGAGTSQPFWDEKQAGMLVSEHGQTPEQGFSLHSRSSATSSLSSCVLSLLA
jgi:hypothetical protein